MPVEFLNRNKNQEEYDSLINSVFDEIDTGGGGDCLFKSLSYSLYDTPKNHAKVRQAICKAPIPKELEPFYIKSERKKMCNLTEWGTHLEIIIAAKLYKRPIIVYKKKHNTGIGSLCEGQKLIQDIKNKKAFKGVRRYLSDKEYKDSEKRIYCIYLPDNNTNAEPIILYNINDIHYRVLKPKKLVHFDSKINYDYDYDTIKIVRKSKKTSRKTSRKTKKVSRKTKKDSRKTKKVSRKTKKVSRKTKKVSRKTKKVSRKTKKVSRKTKKVSKKTKT
jgi:hypothetical protein